MDKEDIKKAFDKFENDEFVDSKEILSKSIKDKIHNHLKDKLKLQNDIEEKPDNDDNDE